MPGAAARIAHVMQAIEARHEIEAGLIDVLGAHGLERHPIAQSMRLGVASRFLHRRFVEVVPDETRVGVSFGHQDRREPDTTPDIRHLRARCQLVLDTGKRRQPVLNDIVHIARSEERSGRTEQAPGGVAPTHARAGPKGTFDFRFAFDHRRDQIESAFEVDGTVLRDEHHGLLRRQAEGLRGTVEIDVAARCLSERPLAYVALRQPTGSLRQFGRRDRPVVVERLEQAEPQSQSHRRYAEGSAKVGKHLADERMKLVLIELCHAIPSV